MRLISTASRKAANVIRPMFKAVGISRKSSKSFLEAHQKIV
jgi:hypothetical protein